MGLDLIDIVGYRPLINVFGYNRYVSTFGQLIGTITIFISSILCLYFTINMFLRSEISLLYNISHSTAKIDISSSPLLLLLKDGLNNPISDEYHELRINFWNFTKEEGDDINYVKTYEIPLESCEEDNLGKYAPLFNSNDYKRMKCIPYNKFNLTLFGDYKQNNANSLINIVVNMCNNQTKNNSCPPKSQLEPHLKNVYLEIWYVDYEVNHKDFAEPIKSYVRSDTLPINWDIHSRYFYAFNALRYMTDIGTVFEDNREEKSYRFSHLKSSAQIQHGSSLYPGITIGTVTFYTQAEEDQYYRTYPKIQTLLARIGGAIQGIIIISRAICHFVTKNMFLIDIMNLNFLLGRNESTEEETHKININHSSNLHLSLGTEIKRNVVK